MFCNKCGSKLKYNNLNDIMTIKKYLEQLSDEERIIVLAYYYDNLSIKEIAKLLRIKWYTVIRQLYLTRKHLIGSLRGTEEKQGGRLSSEEKSMIILALDDIMNSKVEITTADLSARFIETCNEIM